MPNDGNNLIYERIFSCVRFEELFIEDYKEEFANVIEILKQIFKKLEQNKNVYEISLCFDTLIIA